MENLKISHVNGDVMDAITIQLRKQHGKEAELKIHQGKLHDYLRMKLDYRDHVKLKINMTDYLKNILDDLPRKYQGEAITPVANHIFEVNNTTCKLSKGYTQAFHTIVTKLLFLCNLERPNILTGVAFLTTRVREPG